MLVVMAESTDWLEKFNQLHDVNYEIGDWVGLEEILFVDEFGEHYLQNAFDDFNCDVAHEKVIWLQEVE